jgi:hypothetical protein
MGAGGINTPASAALRSSALLSTVTTPIQEEEEDSSRVADTQVAGLQQHAAQQQTGKQQTRKQQQQVEQGQPPLTQQQQPDQQHKGIQFAGSAEPDHPQQQQLVHEKSLGSPFLCQVHHDTLDDVLLTSAKSAQYSKRFSQLHTSTTGRHSITARQLRSATMKGKAEPLLQLMIEEVRPVTAKSNIAHLLSAQL